MLACTPNLSQLCSFDSSSCRYSFRRARDRRWFSRTRAGFGANAEGETPLPDVWSLEDMLPKGKDAASLLFRRIPTCLLYLPRLVRVNIGK